MGKVSVLATKKYNATSLNRSFIDRLKSPAISGNPIFGSGFNLWQGLIELWIGSKFDEIVTFG